MCVLRKGAIVNISPVYGHTLDEQIPAYMMAKAGIIGLTRSLAIALTPNIRINAVLPGNTDTDMTRAAGEEFIRKVIEETPLKRQGQPEEVADLVWFLLNAKFITGHTIVIDGGLSIRP